MACVHRAQDERRGRKWMGGRSPSEDLPRCLEIYIAAFRKREIFEMEYRLRRYDGVYRWILDRGIPYLDGKGDFAGYIGSCNDITDRVEAQGLLRRMHDAEVKRLRGLLPMCSSCKNIRDDRGYWQEVAEYITEHSEAKFSHGICPKCLTKLYPDFTFSNKE